MYYIFLMSIIVMSSLKLNVFDSSWINLLNKSLIFDTSHFQDLVKKQSNIVSQDIK